MSSLVADFQKDILNPKNDVTHILRVAKVISAKLALDDIEKWIGHELNGYDETKSLPPYRHAYGSLQVRNPYRGWQTVTGGNTQMPFAHSMPQIEDFARQDTIGFQPQENFQISSGWDAF